jgi:hypothetical protein
MGAALAVAVAVALPYGSAPPPAYFLTGYNTNYQQAHHMTVPGRVAYHETAMFRIEPRRT